MSLLFEGALQFEGALLYFQLRNKVPALQLKDALLFESVRYTCVSLVLGSKVCIGDYCCFLFKNQ